MHTNLSMINIQGLFHLQKHGVCHRDLSLENILVDENSKALVIDLGMCLRLPYNSPNGCDTVCDSTVGTLRKLVTPQGQCGKPNYISPEILQNTTFDGFSVDIWAAGIVLFIMLVGLPPFEWASMDDPRFRLICRGGLKQLVDQWQRPISLEAVDLLQQIFREDPRDRPSLFQIMQHPFLNNINNPYEDAIQVEQWRQQQLNMEHE